MRGAQLLPQRSTKVWRGVIGPFKSIYGLPDEPDLEEVRAALNDLEPPIQYYVWRGTSFAGTFWLSRATSNEALLLIAERAGLTEGRAWAEEVPEPRPSMWEAESRGYS